MGLGKKALIILGSSLLGALCGATTGYLWVSWAVQRHQPNAGDSPDAAAYFALMLMLLGAMAGFVAAGFGTWMYLRRVTMERVQRAA